MWTLFAIFLAFVLDWCFGDPPKIPHFVVWVDKLVTWLEEQLRPLFSSTSQGERTAGGLLVTVVCVASFGAALVVCLIAGAIHPVLRLVVETFLCWQCLALRSLEQSAAHVHDELRDHGLEAGRKAVGMIVGRDTASLSEGEVVCAAIETVAENTSDGEVAPLFFMMVGGAPLAVLYKAVNTMDSMVGYITPPYTHFGTVAARLDDVANFIPARLAGLAMVLAAKPARLDMKGAWRIFKRDRKNHRSPNSGQTESACAGALGVQLGGTHTYFGQEVAKPTIGDATRPVERGDIKRATRLMSWTSIIAFVVFALVRLLVVL